jgi:GntR family transcriptional regulator / MocR family aminotransferase
MIANLDGEGPLYQQLYRAVRSSILSGGIARGSRLPVTRSLARELGISRNVVLIAYEQLIAEGYLVGCVGSGTYVNAVLPDAMLAVSSHTRQTNAARAARISVSDYARRALDLASGSARVTAALSRPIPYNFHFGRAATDDFPHEIWRRLIARHAKSPAVEYAAPEGYTDLRTAIADHLLQSRGVVCEPDQVFIVNGGQQGIDLTARVLLNPGDAVLMEDPHYLGAHEVFHSANAKIFGVPVDDSGLQVAKVLRRADPVKLLYTTPSHQYPTGAILSLDRRLQLLDWAARNGTCILEDDYDGEYRYEGRPLESLQGLDRAGCVIYLGTFSRAIFPALRLGYLVVPKSLADVFRIAKWLTDRHTPVLPQQVLADFLREGHFERYLRRLRARNDRRRTALLEALNDNFGATIQVSGATSGIHVLVRFKNFPASLGGELVARAARAGVGVYSAAKNYLRPPQHVELILGYGALSERAIRAGILALKGVIDTFAAPVRHANIRESGTRTLNALAQASRNR